MGTPWGTVTGEGLGEGVVYGDPGVHTRSHPFTRNPQRYGRAYTFPRPVTELSVRVCNTPVRVCSPTHERAQTVTEAAHTWADVPTLTDPDTHSALWHDFCGLGWGAGGM